MIDRLIQVTDSSGYFHKRLAFAAAVAIEDQEPDSV